MAFLWKDPVSDGLGKGLAILRKNISAGITRLWTIGNYSGVPAVPADEGTTGQVLTSAGAGAQPTWSAAAGGSNALLDGSSHTDTAAGTVVRGDVITGQSATPKWTRLAKGTANQVLKMDGTATDVVWGDASGAAGAGGQKYLYIPAGGGWRFHDGTAGTAVIRGSTDTAVAGQTVFNSATLDRYASTTFVVPQGYSAVASIKLIYCGTGTTGGNTVFKVGMDVLNDADSAVASITYGTNTTVAAPATQDQVDIASLNLPSVTLAAGDVVKLNLVRMASDGSDTNPDQQFFIGLLIEFTLA